MIVTEIWVLSRVFFQTRVCERSVSNLTGAPSEFSKGWSIGLLARSSSAHFTSSACPAQRATVMEFAKYLRSPRPAQLICTIVAELS